ncbi:MAG: asparagine synthase (glutamine-hydrolyzing) [bacterium]|nr:asparagine synthase (glutamine-hydrolyzing) [bacterium]
MCGIDGIISHTPLDDVQRNRLRTMNNVLAHRGPNGEGFHITEHVGLAMRRLSVIDLEGAWQPIYNEDRSLAVICNGEVYNYIELRRDLIARGHQMRTDGDVETVLHLYEECGLDVVHALRGMYAFALHDTPNNRVLIVRDRMGEKPLYYWHEGQTLIFASELKALLAALPHQPDLDPQAIDLFFHYGYVPEPRTPLQGIHKLPAGHMLIVDIDPWRVEQRQYWDMLDAPPLESDPIETIRAELHTVSELVIRSDVPVGLALSGGLDSSALAVLTARTYPGTLRAFSVGYPGRPANDERDDAKALADHLKIPFYDIEIVQDDMVRFFPDLMRAMDDPIADIAGYGYYIVSKLARENDVPVLLQGQGGDELFWGYPWVKQAAADALLKQELLREELVPAGGMSGLMPNLKRIFGKPNNDPEAARRARLNDGYPDTFPFIDAAPDFQVASQRMQQLYAPGFAAQIAHRSAYQPFTASAPWQNVPSMVTRLISQTYLQENGIAQGDRLSMASSVELRLPFVDYKLVETVIGLRKAQPDHTMPPKAWLRGALQGIVPEWVMNRPKKGFAPPIYQWYTALLENYGKSLPDGVLAQRGILKADALHKLAQGDGLMDGVITLPFKALTLELWARKLLSA